MYQRFLYKLAGLALILAFFGSFSSETLAQTEKQRRQARKLIDDGKKAFNARRYLVAVRNFSDALAILPNDPDARFYKGRIHYQAGQYDLAVPELESAERNGYKPAVEIYRIRWQAYDKTKKFDLALADVNRLLAAEPSNRDLLVFAADISYNKGDYQAAATAFEKLILASPNAPNIADLYYKLAVSKSKFGDIDGQAAAAEEALKRNTLNRADALLILGDARYFQKRVADAIDAYSKALMSRPDKVEAYRKLAELYRGEDRIDEGIDILIKGKNLYPRDGDIYTDLSLFYSLAGKSADAVEAGKAATLFLPERPDGHKHLCRAYTGVNKPELAIGSCNSALRLAPNDGEALFYLGRAYDNAKNQKEADKAYASAVDSLTALTKAHPESADGFYLLGNAYFEVKDNARSIQAYQRSIELNPRYARARLNLGIIYVNQRNKPAAMEQYNALLRMNERYAADLKTDIDRLPAN